MSANVPPASSVLTQPLKRGRKQKTGTLKTPEKRQLASLVHANSVLWSLSDPNHKNAAAWATIAATMNIPEADCKKGWKALKDGLRYQRGKPTTKKKSGDSNDELECDVEAWSESENTKKIEGWKFYDDVRFLWEGKPERRTVASATFSDVEDVGGVSATQVDIPTSPDVVDNAMNAKSPVVNDTQATPVSSSGASNHDYMAKSKRRKVASDGTDEILCSINKLVELRTQEGVIKDSDGEELKYKYMYANLDRMLRKLPENVVDDLNIEFLQIARAAVRRYEGANVITFDQPVAM